MDMYVAQSKFTVTHEVATCDFRWCFHATPGHKTLQQRFNIVRTDGTNEWTEGEVWRDIPEVSE